MISRPLLVFLFILSLVPAPKDAFAEPLRLLDAVRFTLVNNPDVMLQGRQVDVSRGQLQQAVGQFDAALRFSTGREVDYQPLLDRERQTYASQGVGLNAIKTDNTRYSVAVDKVLRNGLILSPELSAIRYEGSSYDLSGLPAVTRGLVSFNIRVPLLKNSGKIAAAGEEAARIDLEATRQDLRFAVSQSLYGTVASYWNLLAAQKNLQIAIEAENAIRRMVSEVEKLIAADEMPAADIHLIRASQLEKTASRVAAEQAVVSARHGLAQAMGMTPSSAMAMDLVDDFPALKEDLPFLTEYQNRLAALALARRGDLVAARLREDATRVIREASRHNLKPQLDLDVRVGYAGLAEGRSKDNFASALDRNGSGTNLMVSLSYQWPFENNVARGRFLQDSASHDQRTLLAARKERDIELGVQAVYTGLVRSLLQLRDSQEVVDLYALTLKNEKIKHTLGTATLIEVLSVNDRLLAARLNNIAYRLRFMNLMAQLNFETGALFSDDASGQSISFEQLVSLPRID